MSSMPTSQSIWNALLTVLGVALLACLGWQMSEISKLKEMQAAESSVEFTTKDANELRDELTTIMQQIDLRISLIERDIDWIKTMPGLKEASAGWEPPIPAPQEDPAPVMIDPAPKPSPEPPPPPKTDLPSSTKLDDIIQREMKQMTPRYNLRK